MTVTSGIKLLMKAESTYGSAPGGAMSEVRMTSEDLSPNMEYTESAAIRSDGQITEMIRTDAEGGGSINGELCYDTNVFDELARGAMVSAAWNTVSPVSVATTIEAVAATGGGSGSPAKLTDSGNGLAAIKEGTWIKVTGFTGNTANNTIFKVSKSAAGVLHVIGNPLYDDSAGESVTITPLAEIMNGKTVPSFTFEREDTDDISGEFHLYTGLGVQSMDITVPTSGILTWTAALEGKKPTSADATTSGGSDNAQTTNSPMAAADVQKFWEGDTILGSISGSTHGTGHEWYENPFQLLDFNVSITPNLRSRKTIGSLGPSALPGRGDINVTGSFRCYYNSDADGAEATRTNRTLIDKGLDDTRSSLAIFVKDAANNGYIIDLPRVQFTSVSRTTPGKSDDVIAEVEFQAYRNDGDFNFNGEVDGATIRIVRGTSL